MTELRSKYSKEIQDAKSVVNELLLESDDQWKMCKEWANGSVYYRKSPSMSGHIYKVVFELNIGLEKSIQSIYPAPRGFREKWDPNLERSVILKEDGESWLLLSVTKPAMSGLIAGREFIDLLTIDRLSLSRVIASGKSVEYPEIPKKSELVRGYNYPCGTLWEVISGSKVRISVMYHSDIGGRVPRRLVEKALPSVMQSDVEALLNYLKTL